MISTGELQFKNIIAKNDRTFSHGLQMTTMKINFGSSFNDVQLKQIIFY